MICTGFYTLPYITAALVQGSRPSTMTCTRVYTILHITKALAERRTPLAVIYTRAYNLCTYHCRTGTSELYPLQDKDRVDTLPYITAALV